MYREREKLPSNKFILILLLLPEAKPIGHRLQQVLVVVVVVLSNPDFTCTYVVGNSLNSDRAATRPDMAFEISSTV